MKLKTKFTNLDYNILKINNSIEKELERYNQIKKLQKIIPNITDKIILSIEKLNDPVLPDNFISSRMNEKDIKKIMKYSISKVKKIKSNNKKIIIKEEGKYLKLIPNLYPEESVKILKSVYNRINKRRIKKINNDFEIWSSIYRYKYLNLLTNVQGTVKQEYYDKYKNHNIEVELFGSLFNAYHKYYFGLFGDIEENFGCLGNIFESKLKKGFFVGNPPFNKFTVNNFYKKILDEINKDIVILIIVPNWTDKEFKINRLKNSKLLIDYKLYSKKDFKYNEIYNNIKDRGFVDTQLFLISNKKISYFRNQRVILH